MNSDPDLPHKVSQDGTAESGNTAQSPPSLKETSASNAGVGVGGDVHGNIQTTYVQIGIGEIIGTKFKNKKMILALAVIISVAYYLIVGFQWVPGEVLYSDFHEMDAGKIYSFGASVALKDSIEAAKKTIPTGIKIGGDALNASTESIEGGETEFGNDTKIGHETMKVSRSAKLILTGEDRETFSITPKTPEVLGITDNNPGHNYATWLWLVKPLKKGSHTLYLYAYSVDDNGNLKQFDSKTIPIKVIVASAQSTPAVPANVTSPTNVTEPAENATGALVEEPAAEAVPVEEAVPVVVEPVEPTAAVEEPAVEAVPVEEAVPVVAEPVEPTAAVEEPAVEAVPVEEAVPVVAEPVEPTAAVEEPAVEAVPVEEAVPVVAEPVEPTAAVEEPAVEAVPVEEAVPVVAEPVEPTAAVEERAAEAAPAAENATAAAEEQPGFESIFAITGLLAVAYLVLGRRA